MSLLNDSITKEDMVNLTGQNIELESSSEEDEESFSESFTDAWSHETLLEMLCRLNSTE